MPNGSAAGDSMRRTKKHCFWPHACTALCIPVIKVTEPKEPIIEAPITIPKVSKSEEPIKNDVIRECGFFFAIYIIALNTNNKSLAVPPASSILFLY